MTAVQTCALPIYVQRDRRGKVDHRRDHAADNRSAQHFRRHREGFQHAAFRCIFHKRQALLIADLQTFIPYKPMRNVVNQKEQNRTCLLYTSRFLMGRRDGGEPMRGRVERGWQGHQHR